MQDTDQGLANYSMVNEMENKKQFLKYFKTFLSNTDDCSILSLVLIHTLDHNEDDLELTAPSIHVAENFRMVAEIFRSIPKPNP